MKCSSCKQEIRFEPGDIVRITCSGYVAPFIIRVTKTDKNSLSGVSLTRNYFSDDRYYDKDRPAYETDSGFSTSLKTPMELIARAS